jgi:hypothetical protein
VIKEFEGKLKAWIWVTVSVAVTVVTYVALFWKDMISVLQRTSANLRRFNLQGVTQFLRRSTLFLLYFVRKFSRFIFGKWLVFLCISILLVGLGVGIWALATKTTAVVRLGVGVGIGVVSLLVCSCYIRWRWGYWERRLLRWWLGWRREEMRHGHGLESVPSSASSV